MKNFKYLNISIIFFLTLFLVVTGCKSTPTYVPPTDGITLSKKEAVSKIRAIIIASFRVTICLNSRSTESDLESIKVDYNKIYLRYYNCDGRLAVFNVNFSDMYYNYMENPISGNKISISEKGHYLNFLYIFPETETQGIEFQEALYVLGARPSI